MAFSRLLCTSAVYTGRGAGATQVSMTSGIGAATMVLVVSMLAPTNQAHHHFLISVAALCRMVEGPAMLALLDEGTRHKLTDTGLTPEHKQRVAGHVL